METDFGPLHELESVRGHVQRAASAAAEYLAKEMLGRLERVVAGADSPIEAIFMLWWDMLAKVTGMCEHVTLHTQFGFAPINDRSYRVDFAIWPKDLDAITTAAPFRCVVVELDGHDYHERTKEQVIARNQRDRDLQEKGYIVLHFSGSEIHRDPYAVLIAVNESVSRELIAFRRLVKAEKQG